MIHVGTSGWSYPSWRGGFYPAGADPKTFLAFYAERFDTVELNTTGYRLPAEDQFKRWAEQTPDGIHVRGEDAADAARPRRHVRRACRRARQQARADTDRRRGRARRGHARVPARLAAAGARVAYDFRHESWEDVDGIVRVNDFDAEPFRYIRLREPPYSDDDLRESRAACGHRRTSTSATRTRRRRRTTRLGSSR